MSSQESRSVRVVSRTAFTSDPLFEEVSTPNISFTESVPQVASCPGDEKATRLVLEQEAFTSSREEEKEEEVEVSCANLKSTIIGEDEQRIVGRYNLEVVMAYELERLHCPPAGYVAVSEAYLKFGVKFPLHPSS